MTFPRAYPASRSGLQILTYWLLALLLKVASRLVKPLISSSVSLFPLGSAGGLKLIEGSEVWFVHEGAWSRCSVGPSGLKHHCLNACVYGRPDWSGRSLLALYTDLRRWAFVKTAGFLITGALIPLVILVIFPHKIIIWCMIMWFFFAPPYGLAGSGIGDLLIAWSL